MDCPTCGTSNPPQARFCLNCGSPLAAEAPTPAREERKVVSVLFADLVGFTARAEKLDPEDVEQILRPYHDRVRADIERYGGTVEKFIGDAVMAVFGAPIAREDDAERAVRAGLAVRDWARDESGVELRVAVNTGEALVSVDARPELGQTLVKGDVVNTAARLQAAAPVNGVLVGATTYRATQAAINYGEAESIIAKGKSEPVVVWEALEARSSFGVDVRQVGRAPLIGRQRELSALVEALNRARSDREPQLVTLIGVPGIGKSRLLWELFQKIDAEHDVTTWRQGRSLPYGSGVSFWALGEMIKAQSGILESDEPETATFKLEASVAGAIGEEGQRDWVAGHLGPLVGIGGGSGGMVQRGEAFAAWRRYLEALAEQHPLVLVFEDLHWADDGMLDFVDYLADWARGVPLLVVGTARPELLARRPNWGGGKSNALTLSVAPLSEAETAQLVHSLFDRPVLAAETQQALLEQAGGNPLYAEEFVRLAQEGGLQQTLPENVQAIIAARIDALAADEKRLLQQASVLGKVFWLGGLAEVAAEKRWTVEETLHRLDRREFVRRERRSSVAAETEFVFRHALVRDVAYEQLARAERAQLHVRAAHWIETLGRAEDNAEMLAHHYMAALEYARAAGRPLDEFVEPARLALRVAGERALALNSFQAARTFYDAALALTPADASERPALLFGQARAMHAVGEGQAIQAMGEAAEALARAGDHEHAAEAHVMMAELWWHRGVRDETNHHLARAEELIRDVGPTQSRARVLSEISRYHMLADRAPEAIAFGQQAIALARQLELPAIEAHALDNVGFSRFAHGDLNGLRDLERSLELAHAANSPEAARTLNNLAVVTFISGDLARSEEFRRAGAREDRSFGRNIIARFAEGSLVTYEFFRGAWDEYLAAMDRFARDSDQVGRNYVELYMVQLASLIHLARGEEEKAAAGAQAAADWARRLGESQVLIPALASAAFVEAELGRHDAARAIVAELAGAPRYVFIHDVVPLAARAEVLGVASEIRALLPVDAPPSKFVTAIVAILDDDLLGAASVLEEAGHRPYAAIVRTEAARRLALAGRRSEADLQLREALEFWRFVRADRYVATAEGLLSRAG